MLWCWEIHCGRPGFAHGAVVGINVDWDGTDALTQNLHKEYFLKYKSQGKEKIAQFTFLQNHAATQFHNDLELWSGLSVKLVGPQNENGSLENVKKQAQLNSAVNLLQESQKMLNR